MNFVKIIQNWSKNVDLRAKIQIFFRILPNETFSQSFSNIVEKCIYWLVSVNAWIITQVYWYAYCLSRMCLRRVRQIFFSYIGSHHHVVSILQSTFLDTLVWLPLYFRVFLTFSIYLTFHTPISKNPIDYLLMRLLLWWIW